MSKLITGLEPINIEHLGDFYAWDVFEKVEEIKQEKKLSHKYVADKMGISIKELDAIYEQGSELTCKTIADLFSAVGTQLVIKTTDDLYK